jgi:hypothetical protein
MFDSLDDQMKHDDAMVVTARERYLKYIAIIVISVALVGGLLLAMQLME